MPSQQFHHGPKTENRMPLSSNPASRSNPITQSSDIADAGEHLPQFTLDRFAS